MSRKKGTQKPRREFDDLSDLDQDMIIKNTTYMLEFIDTTITVIDELGNNLEQLKKSLGQFSWHAKASAHHMDEACDMMKTWFRHVPLTRECVLAELYKRKERLNKQLELARIRKQQQAQGQQKLDFLDILMMKAKMDDPTQSLP